MIKAVYSQALSLETDSKGHGGRQEGLTCSGGAWEA